MTAPIQGEKTKSSIGISQEIVCEDEACIGKVVDAAAAAPMEATGSDETTKASTRSSMGVGGEEICADDACIGKR